jgi:hypothetical protein
MRMFANDSAEPGELLGVFHVDLLDLAVEVERRAVEVIGGHGRIEVAADVEAVVGHD